MPVCFQRIHVCIYQHYTCLHWRCIEKGFTCLAWLPICLVWPVKTRLIRKIDLKLSESDIKGAQKAPWRLHRKAGNCVKENNDKKRTSSNKHTRLCNTCIEVWMVEKSSGRLERDSSKRDFLEDPTFFFSLLLFNCCCCCCITSLSILASLF